MEHADGTANRQRPETYGLGSYRGVQSRRKLVVTASYDGTAGVWDVGTGRELHVLHHAANSKVYSAHFSKDGNYIVTASLDRTARVWDAHTGLPVGEPLPSGDTVWDAVSIRMTTCGC